MILRVKKFLGNRLIVAPTSSGGGMNNNPNPPDEVLYCPNCHRVLVNGQCQNSNCQSSPNYNPPATTCPTCHQQLGSDGLCHNTSCTSSNEYIDPTPITYTVTWNFNGGSVNGTIKTIYNKNEQLEFPEPIKENYILQGWITSDGDVITDTYKVTSNITINATWVRAGNVEPPTPTIYTVTWNNCGNITTTTVNDGDEIGTLSTPINDGFTFDGWYTSETSGTKITSTYQVTQNITLFAHWNQNTPEVQTCSNCGQELTNGICQNNECTESPNYTPLVPEPTSFSITYDLNGHERELNEDNPSSYISSSSDIIPLPPKQPSQDDGYEFVGWIPASISSGSEGDKTFVAQWELKEYTINWFTGGYGELPSDIKMTYTVEDEDYILPNIECEGLIFRGWLLSDNIISKLVKGGTGNLLITSIWDEVIQNKQDELDEDELDETIYKHDPTKYDPILDLYASVNHGEIDEYDCLEITKETCPKLFKTPIKQPNGSYII